MLTARELDGRIVKKISSISKLRVLYVMGAITVLVYDFFGDYLKANIIGYKFVNLTLTCIILVLILMLEFKKYYKR
jgi:hypothetical protein